MQRVVYPAFEECPVVKTANGSIPVGSGYRSREQLLKALSQLGPSTQQEQPIQSDGILCHYRDTQLAIRGWILFSTWILLAVGFAFTSAFWWPAGGPSAKPDVFL